MGRKIYRKLKRKLWLKDVRQTLRQYRREIGLALLLLSLVFISSSGRQIGILSRYRIAHSGIITATAYNSLPNQTDSTPWITALGTRCRRGVIASNFLPFGAKVMIEGFGERIFVVEDRMNQRYNRRIDIWMRNYDDAVKFGRRKIKYFVLES